jgi:hypothetical protein
MTPWKSRRYYMFRMWAISLCYSHAQRKHLITLSSVASPATPYLSTLSHKRQYFRKKSLLYIKYVFWFFLKLLSEISFILRRTHRDTTINVHRSSCKVPVTLIQICLHKQFMVFLLLYKYFLGALQESEICLLRPLNLNKQCLSKDISRIPSFLE